MREAAWRKAGERRWRSFAYGPYVWKLALAGAVLLAVWVGVARLDLGVGDGFVIGATVLVLVGVALGVRYWSARRAPIAWPWDY